MLLKIKGEEGNWNEKFYGKDKNEIYLNNNKIVLAEEEIKSIREQQENRHINKETLDFQEGSRKTAQIVNYIEDLAKITENTEDLEKFYISINKEMLEIVRKRKEGEKND